MTSDSAEKAKSDVQGGEQAEPSSVNAANDQPQNDQARKNTEPKPSDFSHVSPEVLAEAIAIAMDKQGKKSDKQEKSDTPQQKERREKEQFRDNLIIGVMGILIMIDWLFLGGSYLINLLFIASLGGVAYAYWRYKTGTLNFQENSEKDQVNDA